ncbi:hypothetical protein MVLG_02778 [Microbotryum lychnidis-dioicae p1A1 Lamole]|uniref:Phosphoglycerate mutase n=1 Tax=Microbotryum lychnidis-dioicae (strain p1A1 Lamole / MvSl-1064) TaxID=683840 RepID=U5H674_USTV1|nr:hypothetical protein MVLG_02778 [Microbotryum lychnidis-dioicae p1A1 Lamole]|eukprot:KDE06890.1 hypothetical protein MVLG_02778 [Microbotryum lychnidis-dioicae p1A1 Lamole]
MGKHGHPTMPRLILIRHGETEWSLNGRHTGKTDIPLTSNGEELVRSLGQRIVGKGKMLDPDHIQGVLVSPRQRAQTTFSLLFRENLDEADVPKSETEQDVQEWDYGKYEGLVSKEIRERYKEDWDIWVDGCEGGESAEEMTARCDRVIAKIVNMTRDHHESNEEHRSGKGDVVVVSHGHFTRCLLTRWCELPLTDGRRFVADTGAITICGYQHGSFKERSLLGMNLFGEV